MQRLNKEYKLNVCNHIIVKYGSVNKDNPQVVYISGKCWVSPQREMDYNNVIDGIEERMKKNIKSFLIEADYSCLANLIESDFRKTVRRVMLDGINFENRLILDFDVVTDKMFVGSRKYLCFEIYLRQNEKNKKRLKDLSSIITSKTSIIANSLAESLHRNGFLVGKQKTKLD